MEDVHIYSISDLVSVSIAISRSEQGLDERVYLWTFVSLMKISGSSVVECLTRDREAAGSSLTGVTALCP